MAGIKIVDLPAVGRDLAATDLFEMSLAGGTGSRKITGQEIMNASKLSVNNTPVINGTSGRIFFQGSTNVLQQSANLFFDQVNGRVGINTSLPASPLDVVGNGTIGFQLMSLRNTNASGWTEFNLLDNNGVVGGVFGWGNSSTVALTNSLYFKSFRSGSYAPILFTQDNGTAINYSMSISSQRNVLIGTTTDAGFRLDVNGTARVQGNLTTSAGIQNFSNYQGYGQMQLFSGNAFQMFNSANNSKASFQYTTATGLSLSINPENLSGILNGLAIGPSLVASANNNTLVGLDINPTFTNGAFTGVTNWGIRSQARVLINPTLSGVNSLIRMTDNSNGTTTFGFSNVTTTGFYINSNAAITIGTSSVLGDNQAPTGPFINLRNATGGKISLNTASVNDGISFSDGNNGTIRMNFPSSSETAITTVSSHNFSIGVASGVGSLTSTTMKFFQSTGNVGINTTTDAGFRLDVNGTARIQNEFIINRSDGIEMFRMFNSAAVLAFNANNSSTPTFRLHSQAGVLFYLKASENRIGINTISPNASAILDVASTTQGFLPPRMTQTQRNAIASPAIGLEIYQTDATEGKYIYKSSGWTYIG